MARFDVYAEIAKVLGDNVEVINGIRKDHGTVLQLQCDIGRKHGHHRSRQGWADTKRLLDKARLQDDPMAFIRNYLETTPDRVYPVDPEYESRWW